MIKSYLKDGKKLYQVIVRKKDSKGKQHCKKKSNLSSERKAKEIEFQLQNEMNELISGEGIFWNWGEWHEECLKKMRLSFKISTLKGYDGCLKKWLSKEFVELPIDKIKAQDIYKVIFENVGDKVSPHYQRNLLKMIRRILEMALEEGIITRNPAIALKVKVPKTQQKVLNSKEAEILLSEAFKCNHRFYKVWAFALMTGMRSGEMFALRWQDVDLETGFISINKQWTNKDGLAPPKNREDRKVPINNDLRRLLMEFTARNESYSQELWDSRSKKTVAIDDFVLPRLKEWEHGEQAQVLRSFCQALGTSEIRFHDLRATFITNMLSQGASLVQVMSIVGHRKMSTTDEYLRLAGVGIKGATKKLSYKLPQEVSEGKVVSLFQT